MNDKLEIHHQQERELAFLILKGRLDAYWSATLSESLDELLKDSLYDIRLDMKGVDYMSSAGIRILLTYYKKLETIQGSLRLTNPSDKVKAVIEMAGLRMLFDAGDKATTRDDRETFTEQTIGHTHYRFLTLDEKNTLQGILTGNPEIIYSPTVLSGQYVTINFQQPKFGVGLGAFGDTFDDFKARLGEFIALGDVIAWLPTDGKNRPDYLKKQGLLVPKVNLLYGMLCEGRFSHLVHFENPGPEKGIRFSQLLEDIQQLIPLQDTCLLMIAEAAGLVGASLAQSPVVSMTDNKPFFSFPAIREQLSFPPEQTHHGMLTVTTGVTSTSQEGWSNSFLRPMAPESKWRGHFHSAVFSYHPLKKQATDYRENIQTLFDDHQFITILHLTNDYRPAVGIGESEFKHGSCWFGAIDSFKHQKRDQP